MSTPQPARLRVPTPAIAASPLLAWAWQIAQARASAASDEGLAVSASSRSTMWQTCSLAALPWPTTACLTCKAVYSATGRSHETAPQIAAPRA